MSLEGLAGKTLLVDFIFTRCPGPCPALTSRNVAVQRLLSDETRGNSRFVSISIDPERDTPEDLARYGEVRGADLEHWSFLTGDPAVVAGVVKAYGVGTMPKDDGDIQHIVASFLVDANGQIVRRYLGSETPPEEIAAALTELASSSTPEASLSRRGAVSRRLLEPGSDGLWGRGVRFDQPGVEVAATEWADTLLRFHSIHREEWQRDEEQLEADDQGEAGAKLWSVQRGIQLVNGECSETQGGESEQVPIIRSPEGSQCERVHDRCD